MNLLKYFFRGALTGAVVFVLLYLLLIVNASGIDLDVAAQAKLEKNARKYPVDKAYGSRAKYTELG